MSGMKPFEGEHDLNYDSFLGFLKALSKPDSYRLIENYKRSNQFREVNESLLSSKYPIKPCVEGACTNGSEIMIQSVIEEFSDENDADENRNRNMYMGFHIHEAAHILEGSFDYVVDYAKEFKESPELAKNLFNMIEDYRIEVNLVDNVRKSEEYASYLKFINNFYACKSSYSEDNIFGNFMDMFLRSIKCEDKDGKRKQTKGRLMGCYEELFDRFKKNNEKDKSKEEVKKDDVKNNANLAVTPKLLEFDSIDDVIDFEKKELSRDANNKLKKGIDVPKYDIKNVSGKLISYETVKLDEKIKFQNLNEILDYIIEETLALKGKSVVDSYIALKRIYTILITQFKDDMKKSNIPNDFSQDGQRGNPGEEMPRESSGKEDNENKKTSPKRKYDSIDDMADDRKRIEEEIKKKAKRLCKDYGEKKKDKKNDPSNLENDNEDDPKLNKDDFYVHSWNSQGACAGERVKINYSEIKDGNYSIQEGKGLIENIRREFLKLRPNQKQFKKGTWKPGINNPFYLYMSRIDPAAAIQLPPFDSQITNKLDVDVKILIDSSGSTDIPSGYKDYSKLDLEKICAALMMASMKEVNGLNVETYFFASGTDTNMIKVDDFSAFSKINSGGGNNDAAAIRFTTKKSLESGSKRKIIFMMADGYPSHSPSGDANKDASKAIEEATNQGIILSYLLFRPEGNDGNSAEDKEKFEELTRHASCKFNVSNPENLLGIISNFIDEYIIRG